MRLYRLGDTGEPVRDIQDRLTALGFSVAPDPRGSFADATREAVIAFQRSRGLPPDGIVGPQTWRALYEAGFRLGDRVLWHRRPMLRGDDVAELQRRLNALGFEAGKVDGIFGPDTERAVREFQQNRHMAEDGIAGPEVVAELRRVARATTKTGRDAVREREWVRRLPRTVAGTRIFLDPACRDDHEMAVTWEATVAAAEDLRGRGAVPIFGRPADAALTERVRARRANRAGVDLVVSFQLPGSDRPGVFFFASPMSRSEAGALLAQTVAETVDLDAGGRASPILKDTRAPAIVVAAEPLTAELGRRVAEGVVRFVADAADRLREPSPIA